MIYDEVVAPLLTWFQVMLICGGVLFLETVVALIVGQVRRLSWLHRLSVLIPLVASAGTGIVALHIHDAYLYWHKRALNEYLYAGHGPEIEIQSMLYGIANAIHEATVLGWVAIVITAILLALGLAGLVRTLNGRKHQGHQVASLAVES